LAALLALALAGRAIIARGVLLLLARAAVVGLALTLGVLLVSPGLALRGAALLAPALAAVLCLAGKFVHQCFEELDLPLQGHLPTIQRGLLELSQGLRILCVLRVLLQLLEEPLDPALIRSIELHE